MVLRCMEGWNHSWFCEARRMKRRKSPSPSYDHSISALFSLLSLILFATFGLAVLFFGERFLF